MLFTVTRDPSDYFIVSPCPRLLNEHLYKILMLMRHMLMSLTENYHTYLKVPFGSLECSIICGWSKNTIPNKLLCHGCRMCESAVIVKNVLDNV